MEEIYHIPAMLKETIDGLAIKPNGVYVDVTFGGGGHSRAILGHLTPTSKPHPTSPQGEEDNPTPGEFYDRPLDARSSGALHPSREGNNPTLTLPSREGRRQWIVYLNILQQGRHHTSY